MDRVEGNFMSLVVFPTPNFCCSERAGHVSITIRSPRRRVAERFSSFDAKTSGGRRMQITSWPKPADETKLLRTAEACRSSGLWSGQAFAVRRSASGGFGRFGFIFLALARRRG